MGVSTDLKDIELRSGGGFSRRSVVAGAAWAAPVIVVASAAPALAASGDTPAVNPTLFKYWSTGTQPGFTSTSSTRYRLRFGLLNTAAGNAQITNVFYRITSTTAYAIDNSGATNQPSTQSTAIFTSGAWTQNTTADPSGKTYDSPMGQVISANGNYGGSIDLVINPRTSFRNDTFTVMIFGRSPQEVIGSLTYTYNSMAAQSDLCQDATSGSATAYSAKGGCTSV